LSNPLKNLEGSVLIVGGSGFIGKALCNQLTKKGQKFVATSRSPGKIPKSLPQVVLDIFDKKNRVEVLKKFEPKTVVLLAWETKHQDYWDSKLNIKYMESALKFAEESYQFQVSKFIGIGSMSEYGYSPGSCNSARDRVNPQDLYSLTKCHMSNELLSISRIYKADANWVRLFHPFGFGEKNLRLIPSLINNMIDKKEVKILNPNHKLDFTHVTDIACAINLIIRGTFPYITDIGTGNPTSVESIVTLLANHLNYPMQKIKYSRSNKLSERNIYVDPNSYLNMTNWRPAKKLDEYLIDYVDAIVSLKNNSIYNF